MIHNNATTAYPLRLHEMSSVTDHPYVSHDRPSRIAGIRHAIRIDAYETEEKLDEACDKLLDAIADEQIARPAPFAFLRRFASSFVPPHRRFNDGNGFD